jgi:tetratricopeptide (TPR) repeat protein
LRDPKDYRCNNALGLWYLRRGQFLKAKEYFVTAVKTVTERNPNPYDGEALYNLGVTLSFLENTRKHTTTFINRFGMLPGWIADTFR